MCSMCSVYSNGALSALTNNSESGSYKMEIIKYESSEKC